MKTEVGLDLKRCVSDFGYFAEHVLGLRLWKGQRKAASSKKFITAIAAPRRTGKSTLLVALAIWTCFREPGARVVIVSAAEASAKDRIEEALLLLARSPLTAGCTTDEGKTKIEYANDSVLFCRSASPRSIRGLGARVKLVILDEASQIDEAVWTAAMFLALDHKSEGSRILVADVPWGSREHWYRRHFALGEDPRHPDVKSVRWTYKENPGLDGEYLERQRDVMPWGRFRSDVLGEWADDDESMFGHDLLMECSADYEPVGPDDVSGVWVVGATDYGFRRDANALVVFGALPDLGLNENEDRVRFIVAHTELHRAGRLSGMQFVRRVASTAQGEQGGAGFAYRYIASEANGVGQMPTEELLRAIGGRKAALHRLDQSAETNALGFGRLRSLLEDGRMTLQRGELLRALGAITAKITESGNVSIEAPRSGGTHADLAFAAASAMGPKHVGRRRGRCLISAYDGAPFRVAAEDAHRVGDLGEIVETGAGIRLPRRPLLADLGGPLIHRAGEHSPYRARQPNRRHR